MFVDEKPAATGTVSSSRSLWVAVRGLLLMATVSLCALTGAATASADWGSQSADGLASGAAAAISCASSSLCAAVDTQGDAAIFNGSSWTGTLIPGGVSWTSVSCPTGSFCMAAGNTPDGTVWTSTWDGIQWLQPMAVSDPSAGLAVTGLGVVSLSCPSSIECVLTAVAATSDTDDAYIWTATDGSWTAQPLSDANMVIALSCAPSTSSVFCAVVDDGGDSLSFDGAAWSTPVPTDLAQPTQISCASSTFCVATDAGGNDSVFDGSGWNAGPPALSPPPPDLGSLIAISSLSCGSDQSCLLSATGVSSSGTTSVSTQLVDGDWSAPAPLPSSSPWVVSCTATSFCAGVDNNGDAAANALSPQPQSISFAPAPSAAVYGGSYLPAASASSGLPVTFSIDQSAQGVCSLSPDGTTVSFTSVGTCVVDADQAGDGVSWAARADAAILLGRSGAADGGCERCERGVRADAGADGLAVRLRRV